MAFQFTDENAGFHLFKNNTEYKQPDIQNRNINYEDVESNHQTPVIDERMIQSVINENVDEVCCDNNELMSPLAENYPDAEFVKAKAKQIIETMVSEEISLKLLSKQKCEVAQRIEQLNMVSATAVATNDELHMAAEVDKYQIGHLGDVMVNTGEISHMLVGNIEQLEILAKHRQSKLSVASQKVQMQYEKFASLNSYYNEQIKARNDEIDLVNLKLADNTLDNGINERSEANMKLKAQVVELNQTLMDMKQEFNEKKSALTAKDDKLLADKNHLQEMLEISKNRVDHLKALRVSKKEESSNKIEALQEEKQTKMNHLKQQKIKMNQDLDILMKSVKTAETDNNMLENKNEELEGDCKDLEGRVNQKTNAFSAIKKIHQDKFDDLTAQLLKSENRLVVIKQDRNKLDDDLNLLKLDYKTKCEEKDKLIAQNIELDNIIRQNKVITETRNLEIDTQKEKMRDLERSIGSIKSAIKNINENISQAKHNAQQLKINHEHKMNIMTVEQSNRIEELNRKRTYAITSNTYFEEQLTNARGELDEMEKYVASIRNESAVIQAEINTKKRTCDQQQNEIFQLKNESLNMSQSILKSPGRAPKELKVQFTGLSSQLTTESESFMEDEDELGHVIQDNRVDALVNKIKLRGVQSSQHSSKN